MQSDQFPAGYPDEGEGEPYSDYDNSGDDDDDDRRRSYTTVAAAVIIILIISGVVLYHYYSSGDSSGEEEEKETVITCGNLVCEGDETCGTCPEDCGECEKEKPVPPIIICGDGTCDDPPENCHECPKDCKCDAAGEYCSKELGKCVSPTCGNGVQEPGEDPYSCCVDCDYGCFLEEETCNETTKKCEMPKISITDERVKELITEFFEGQDKSVISIDVEVPFTFGGVPGVRCRVNVLGEEEWPPIVFVSDDGKESVTVLPSWR